MENSAPDDFADLLTVFNGGVRLMVRAKPGTSRSRAPKIVALADGKRAVEISVAAIAEDGKANDAILSRLAKELDIGKKSLNLKVGAAARLKLVEISGDAANLRDVCLCWLRTL